MVNGVGNNTVRTMIRILSRIRSGFSVCHLNARSLNSTKLDYLKYVFEGSDVDVICVSETWFKPEIHDHIFDMFGYKLYRNDRITNTTGGGVAIYCKSTLRCEVIGKSEDNGIEYLMLEVSDGCVKCIVSCVYNPSRNFSPDPFFSVVANFAQLYEHFIICGDFNTDLGRHDILSHKLIDLVLSNGLVVKNSYPTRYAPNSNPSLLDLLIVSDASNVLLFDQLALEGISDHDLLFCSYNIDFSHVPFPHSYTYRDFKSIDVHSLHREACAIPWEHCMYLENANNKLNFFQSQIEDLFNNHVPLRRVQVRNLKCPWFTREVLFAINNRRKQYCKWRRSPTLRNWEAYCLTRNQSTFVTRRAKYNYFASTLNDSLPSKQLWTNLRKIGVGQKVGSDCRLDPNILNCSFLTSTENNPQFSLQEELLCELNYDFEAVNENDVVESVVALKSNATGEDGIPLRFIKMILPHLLRTLTHIINYCLASSTFPDSWKAARIIPVAKKPRPSLPTDFRPISILPTLSKVFEKILAKQIVGHLNSNSLLSTFQSGFRPQHSCATAMVKILDDIRQQYDQSYLTVLCLLDFSKAFDRVNHSILCKKLRHYFGFSDRAVKLLSSYLSNRSQRVLVGDHFSNVRYLREGVPQGSILGPLLFCIFINDIAHVCNSVSFHLYADDIQIYLSRPIGLIEDLFHRVNDDLKGIYRWSVENGLTLNPSKTQAILISKKYYEPEILPPILLSNIQVKFVDKVTSLGFKINSSLSCNDHINYIIGRIYGCLRKLWTCASFIPRDTKLKLMKTMLVPIITYTDVIYCKLDSVSKNKLQVAFNGMIRYVYGLRRYDHVSAYQNSILGCSLTQYLDARNCIFLHKIIYSKSPRYLYEKLQFTQSARIFNFIIQPFNYTNSSSLFFTYAIRLWNSLPEHIKRASGASQFRIAIFKYFSEQQ